MNKTQISDADLVRQIKALAPWHVDIEVRPGVRTRVAAGEAAHNLPAVSFINTRDWFSHLMGKIYPDGLAGKSFGDHACNCGAYCFWAKEMGAAQTFGYDVREQWIRQANFLLRHRDGDRSGMRFEVGDLLDLPSLGLEQFDVTHFSGIFYHLPDPVTGLKIAADLTKEVIIVNTGTTDIISPEPLNGALVASFEGARERDLMSGVHGLNWYPTGPKVLFHILDWLGFPEKRTVFWRKGIGRSLTNAGGPLVDSIGRVCVVASRKVGLLTNVEDAEVESSKT